MSKPDKPKQSEGDKTSVGISIANKQHFRKEYLPKIVKRTATGLAEEDTLMDTAEGKANADVYQSLGDRPIANPTSNLNLYADLSSAAVDQVAQGTYQGLVGARSDQVSGLKSVKGLENKTASGFSQLARIETVDSLNKLKNKSARASGIFKGATKLGVAVGDYITGEDALT